MGSDCCHTVTHDVPIQAQHPLPLPGKLTHDDVRPARIKPGHSPHGVDHAAEVETLIGVLLPYPRKAFLLNCTSMEGVSSEGGGVPSRKGGSFGVKGVDYRVEREGCRVEGKGCYRYQSILILIH